MLQSTIVREVSCSGVGLHTGVKVDLLFKPAPSDHGVRFIRRDVAERDNVVPALALNVATTQLGTNLCNADGVTVATVEHLLAACAGAGIDNLIVELDGPEAPILDGSSAPFCRLLSTAGVQTLPGMRRVLTILRPVEVRDGVKWVRLSPCSEARFRVEIDFKTRAIGRQLLDFTMTPGAFEREIAFARTFGFLETVEALRARGLARGGSMDNAIVIDGDQVLNPAGLQCSDEFVRHKLLDVIGDLFLAGGPIEGLYEGFQPGHELNNRLLRAIFSDPSSFAWRNAADAGWRSGTT
ncbi:MAG: UDP-3-O-acyl-N-acetylglucosamine deacetylase [Alphaproteobacteria bacterium]|nr:UDP-3-O-acyl-N-acetylglucosamine deacetylase [Alphaproteobacteria bacterium]